MSNAERLRELHRALSSILIIKDSVNWSPPFDFDKEIELHCYRIIDQLKQMERKLK